MAKKVFVKLNINCSHGKIGDIVELIDDVKAYGKEAYEVADQEDVEDDGEAARLEAEKKAQENVDDKAIKKAQENVDDKAIKNAQENVDDKAIKNAQNK